MDQHRQDWIQGLIKNAIHKLGRYPVGMLLTWPGSPKDVNTVPLHQLKVQAFDSHLSFGIAEAVMRPWDGRSYEALYPKGAVA